MKILIATTNSGKLEEIKTIFDSPAGNSSKIMFYSLKDLGINKISPETGKNLKDNSIQKSLFYSNLCPEFLVCAEDSGLEVNCLNGAPGIFSSRYSGKDSSDKKNIQKLLNEMNDAVDRTAGFTAWVALSQSNKLIATFKGSVKGLISEREAGNNGFGYDPIFFYPPFNKTFSQLSKEQKNSISHRKKAFEKLKQYLDLL